MRVPANPNDDDLLRRIQAGDEAAFTALYRRWQGPLYRFALRMSGRTAVAEDVMQETFMTLLRGGGGFDPSRGSLSAYLFGIARHRVQQRLERERLYVPMEGEGGAPEGGAGLPASDDDPHDALARRERIERVRDAVLSLPLHYREAVVLCDLHHATYEEAAAALGCAVGTVRSRLHRGRDLLLGKLRSVADASPALRRVSSAGIS
jgi:RNA polymerase sigma-70 factor (ECF subfamily)